MARTTRSTRPNERRLTLALGLATLAVPATLVAAPAVLASGKGSPLRGPEVGAGAEPSLLSRTYDGRLRRLEVAPEVAALDLLELRDDERARVLAILDERAAALDRVVIENIDLLTQIEGAAEGGMVLRLLHLAAQIHNRFTDVVGHESVGDQLASVLPREQARRLESVAGEYWDALLNEECGEDAGRIERYITQRRMALEMFGAEIEHSVERVFEDTEDDEFEVVLAQLDMTAEQQQAVDNHIANFVKQTRMTPTKQEEVALLMSIYRELDEERRTRLFELVISMGE
jgi:hypothetical protein